MLHMPRIKIIPTMELKFVMSGPDDRMGLKRSQACQSCRKSKKRCTHAIPEDPKELPRSPRSVQTATGLRETERDEAFSVVETTSHGESRPNPANIQLGSPVWRFIGDLNPEALFQKQSDTSGSSSQDKVGVWQIHHKRSGHPVSATKPDKRPHRASVHDEIQRPLRCGLQSSTMHCLHDRVLPPIQDQVALVRIYFKKINSVIPLIDEAAFKDLSAASPSNLVSSVLVQAICLVAAKHHDARQHLRLDSDSQLYTVSDFCHALSSSLDIAFKNRLEKDKLTLIRALALRSQHIDGLDGAEESSLQLMQAVHHAQTLGLHMDSARTEMRDESLGNLFWSLWGLDRLNACMNGRPIMMSNVDIGIKVRDSRLNSSKEFRVWLRIANMIDQVIDLYRPSTDERLTGWENDFPGFEEVIRDCEALKISPDILQTLELFYHAVAIISSRSRSFTKAAESTPSSVRQAYSAILIADILKDEKGRNLLPLPIVPYSLSLALSVAYKHLRQTRLLTSKIRATKQLKCCCTLLDDLASTWWSAGAMAKLGRRALNEANKSPAVSRTRAQQAQYPLQAAHGTDSREAISNHEEADWAHMSSQNNITVQGNSNDSNDASAANVTDGGVQEHGPGGPLGSNGDESSLVGGFALAFNDPFDGIDQLLGNYLDLNLCTNFGDPLFADDFSS